MPYSNSKYFMEPFVNEISFILFQYIIARTNCLKS